MYRCAFPESVCEGFLLKISCGIRFPIIIISSSSHHHPIIISSSSSSFLSLSLFLSFSFLFFLSLSRSSFFFIFSAPQWRRKSCCSSPLRRSGLQVSKTDGKLQFWRPRIVPQLPFKAPSIKFHQEDLPLKLREDDLPFKAPSRRFAF